MALLTRVQLLGMLVAQWSGAWGDCSASSGVPRA